MVLNKKVDLNMAVRLELSKIFFILSALMVCSTNLKQN